MVFSSIVFLFRFLPAFLVIYYLVPKRMKNFILFFASLLFYAWGEPVYVGLMLFSAVLDYFLGRRIWRARKAGRSAAAKAGLIASIAINIALLGFFKYADFAIGIFNSLTGASLPPLHLPLPLGISFYTFQTMSYTIDVYRGKVKAQENLLDFGTFVTMFPQLIAGPIVRYETVEKQLKDRRVTADALWSGARRFILGLGKKALLANQTGQIWERTAAMEVSALPVGVAWLGILAFAFQIYFDFSGYSDMAIGLGRMMGFSFPENFRYPYLADSVTDFWRRWHISLGAWFREYVYIPLGGSRRGPARQVLAILTVWALTGIWHGAEYHFLYWGLWFAAFLLLEKWLSKKLPCRLPRAVARLYTAVVVLFGWVIFALDSPAGIAAYMGALLGLGERALTGPVFWEFLQNKMCLWVILALASTPLMSGLYRRACAAAAGRAAKGKRTWLRLLWLSEGLALSVIFLLSVAFLVDASYNPFLYFRF